ncbi:hypothetical protein H9X85_02115 [Anaerotignum lactatifermentans]|uniref:Uncharacterized protein n=1 Tax=Anaerotignum lactatifermentans TaxID=160404 RepID=A0ABS2G8A9_9FIRM|nr:hypothetical protein [Anaerotignum lactatifermentans]MBM6828426.1 hypothetical protein [Anaerotignum lactatifermentans]MBM6877706.1 hypothetical protein [Anaerotignum lactatifermentans]MBM6950009.1 hypothetical protein [Anaerotignum lactatifermentans]
MVHLRRIFAFISLILILFGMWNRQKEIALLETQYALPVETILSQYKNENLEGIRVNTTTQDSGLVSASCKHKKLYGNSQTAKITAQYDTSLLLSGTLEKGEGKVLVLNNEDDILFQSELPVAQTSIPLTSGEYEVITLGKKCTTNILLSGTDLEISIE